MPNTNTDLTNNDPTVEIEAAAIGITDSLHNDSELGFLLQSVTRIAKARGIKDFNSRDFASKLFSFFINPSVKSEIAQLCDRGQQYAIVPNPSDQAISSSIAIFPQETRDKIPEEIISGLDRLQLHFDIVPQRVSLEHLAEGPFPIHTH